MNRGHKLKLRVDRTGVVNVGAEYDDEQRIFIVAMGEYKRVNKVIDPSPRQILQVVKSLGYQRVKK